MTHVGLVLSTHALGAFHDTWRGPQISFLVFRFRGVKQQSSHYIILQKHRWIYIRTKIVWETCKMQQNTSLGQQLIKCIQTLLSNASECEHGLPPLQDDIYWPYNTYVYICRISSSPVGMPLPHVIIRRLEMWNRLSMAMFIRLNYYWKRLSLIT